MQNNLVRGPPQKSTDHEQQNFITICLSTRYKSGLFAVRCPALNKAALVTIDGAALVILNEAARRSEGSGTEHCHPERLLVILSVSEGSGVPQWSSTSEATGDSKGDMLPDDAVESVYRGSAAHISTFLWRYAPR